jgi:hypothetical protein
MPYDYYPDYTTIPMTDEYEAALDSYDDYGGYEPPINSYDDSYDQTLVEINNPAQEGQTGYGWKYYSDGTAISPSGVYYGTNSSGKTTEIYDPSNPSGETSVFGRLVSSAGTAVANAVKNMFTDGKGNVNWGRVAGAAGAILSGSGGLSGLFGQGNQQKTGYQGKIPSYEAVREQVPGTYDPNRRAGSGGQKYFTDTKYVSPTDAATAKAAAAEEAKGIATLNKANPVSFPPAQVAENVAATQSTENLAKGGVASIPTMKQGTYLSGATDGMADKIPANIDGKQQARLSHGEFVIPADVVSHLGNGNSESGAQRLYAMMDRVRKARTGTTKQGKQINPNKYLTA